MKTHIFHSEPLLVFRSFDNRMSVVVRKDDSHVLYINDVMFELGEPMVGSLFDLGIQKRVYQILKDEELLDDGFYGVTIGYPILQDGIERVIRELEERDEEAFEDVIRSFRKMLERVDVVSACSDLLSLEKAVDHLFRVSPYGGGKMIVRVAADKVIRHVENCIVNGIKF